MDLVQHLSGPFPAGKREEHQYAIDVGGRMVSWITAREEHDDRSGETSGCIGGELRVKADQPFEPAPLLQLGESRAAKRRRGQSRVQLIPSAW